MLTQLEIDQIVNESREADEGPTLLVRRVEAKVRKTCEVACAQALVYASGAAKTHTAAAALAVLEQALTSAGLDGRQRTIKEMQ